MCDQNTTAGISLGADATGSLLSAFGTFANARANKRAAKLNAAYSRQRAEDARERGVEEGQRHGREVAQLKGRQRAALAANGVVLTEGSPMEILLSTEYLAQQDATRIAENAQREAYGYEVEAANFEAEADSQNPFLSAAGGLLTGAARVADRWAIYRDKGINPFGLMPGEHDLPPAVRRRSSGSIYGPPT